MFAAFIAQIVPELKGYIYTHIYTYAYMYICVYIHTYIMCSLFTSNYIHIFIYNLPSSMNKIPGTIYIKGILSTEFKISTE